MTGPSEDWRKQWFGAPHAGREGEAHSERRHPSERGAGEEELEETQSWTGRKRGGCAVLRSCARSWPVRTRGDGVTAAEPSQALAASFLLSGRS